jgi:hypothetical protein
MDPGGKISFRGRLTEKDWREAMHLVRTTRKVQDPRYHGLKALIVAILLAVLAARIPWMLVVAGLLAYIAWEQLSLDRRTWRQQHPGDRNGFFSTAGFEIVTSESTSSRPWEAVVRSFSSAELLVLETGPNSFTVLPRYFFASDEDWQELHILLGTATAGRMENLPVAPPPAPTPRGWAENIGRAGCFVLLGLLVLVIAYLLLGFLVLLLAAWSEKRAIEAERPRPTTEVAQRFRAPGAEDDRNVDYH